MSTDAQAAHALARAIRGDTLDFAGTFAPIKTGRDGLTLDFTDAQIDASGSDYALLLLNADYARVRGGEFYGSDGGGIVARHSDDLRISDADVYDNGGHGISVIQSDQTRIARVSIHDSAMGKGYASGISIFHPIAQSGAPGYHVVITNSDIHDNGPTDRRTTDAYGIIADDFQWTQSDAHPAFGRAALISNNRVHGNGGPGIGAVWSDNVDMLGNDVWGNQIQAAFGRTPDVEIEYRQSAGGRAIGNDLHGGDMLLSGTRESPAEVSGHSNVGGLMLRGVVVGVPDFEPGVQADAIHWDGL